MRKTVLLLLVVVLLLTGCGAGQPKKSSKMMSFDEFVKKYQYETFETLEKKTDEFASDYLAFSNYVENCSREENPFEDWEEQDIDLTFIKYYDKEIRLFNRTASLTGTLTDSQETESYEAVFRYDCVLLSLDSGSKYDDYTFGKIMTLYILDSHPSNCQIDVTIDDEKSTETELIKLFESDTIKPFHVSIFKEDEYFASANFTLYEYTIGDKEISNSYSSFSIKIY